MIAVLEQFHVLRPLWLISVPVLLWLWWVIRPRTTGTGPAAQGIAPHLAAALAVGGATRRRLYPIDGVMLAGVLLAFAASGPTWSRVPNPLVADTAPLVVALEVTPSMETPDLAPTRLERAKFKVIDLIADRAGARTALVAYAGSAHRVAPLTEDPNILRPLLEGLTPQVMPVDGARADAALALGQRVLEGADTAGAILFVLDDLDPADLAAFEAQTDPPRAPVLFLVAAPPDVSVPQLDGIPNASVIRLATDDSDLATIARRVDAAYAAALLDDERLDWNDRGWWLAWPAALLALIWFRRGWTMRWALVLLGTSLVLPAGQARADGWVDWFLTPDQQGRLAYQDNRFSDAGALFQDPMWQGYAKYRAGEYEEAAEVFATLDTAEAAFAEGMARIRFREYRPAIAAFETALERQPDFPEAARNLEIAKAILDYVETAREQSDTGEERGIGADDVVFDNDAERGTTTQIEAADEDAAPLSADQWISSIDTNMQDFLRSRFLLDNQGAAE